MSEFNNLGIIAKNTVVSIIIIVLILCFLPGCTYIYSFFTCIEEEKLLNKFMTSEIKRDMEKNTLSNIYLLCNYIPYKRNKRCKDFEPTDPDIKDYNIYLSHAYNIKSKFDKIKRECDGQFYNTIKIDSDKEIQKNKDLRTEQENEIRKIELQNLSNDKDRNQQWVVSLFSALGKGGDIFIKISEILVSIFKFFVPVTAAGIGNHVVMGFIILLFIIFMILYFVKLRNTNTSPTYSIQKSGTNSGTNSWFSWFNGFNGTSIWSELSETYNYYDNIMNTYSNSILDYTGGIFSTEDNTEEGANNGNTKGATIINRKIQDGKRYDNLSYIMLSELNLTDNEKIKLREYLPIDIENLKYYNIYLPEEKFKFNNIQSTVKWKVENSLKNPNEKIWKINCREIDKIKKKGVTTDTPSFIDDINNKCVININGLESANAVNIQDTDEFMYTTEKIL